MLISTPAKPALSTGTIVGVFFVATLEPFPAFNLVMRILLNVSIPHEQFNAATKDGSVGAKLRRILDETKPEAVYFTEQHGKRSCILIVDLPDASKIPSLAEPWFLTFNA